MEIIYAEDRTRNEAGCYVNVPKIMRMVYIFF